MSTLEKVRESRATLEKELAKIKAKELELEAKEDQKRGERCAKLAPQLLEFLEHSRTSCSDDDPKNQYTNEFGNPRCARCYLLMLAGTNYVPSLANFSIEVTITEA